MATALARLDGTGQLNRARKQQQFFGQRGFTRIRVRNNAESTTAGDFARDQFQRCFIGRDGIVAGGIGE